MRAALGFVVLHVALTATGFALLRALGMASVPMERRTTLATLGPALLAGAALVLPLLIVLLVLGIPLNLISATLVCLACSTTAELVARRRAASFALADTSSLAASGRTWLHRGVILGVGAYFAFGAVALARMPTVSDDARIWSLRGLTLAYYHGLQPEIFQNQAQSGGHAIYPLFQPALEALVFQAMGHPQLRFFHVELWLLFAAAIWTAVYLILRTSPRVGRLALVWVAPLALVALTPAVLDNLVVGLADVTGSVLLATGSLALGLWLDKGEVGCLGLGVVLLAAAANTKDEDLVAAVLILVVGIIFDLARARSAERMHRLRLVGVVALSFAVLVVPWRAWTAIHHLSDSVQPPIPHALSPSYIFSRTHQLNQTITAMLQQTSGEWRWLAAIFIGACVICIAVGDGRRIAGFYLASVIAVVMSLLWLYTTTPVSLTFLLNTSMNRTVDLFMVLAAVATAHLLAHMQRGDHSDPAGRRGAGRARAAEDDADESQPSARGAAYGPADN